MKKILFFGLGLLLLLSCGKEDIEVKKDPKYIYVEIEECTIPVPKIYKMARDGNQGLYEHKYHYSGNNFKIATVGTKKRLKNDYKNVQKMVESIQSMKLGKERKSNSFKIIEVVSTYNSHIVDDYTSYYLFGLKTFIRLIGTNDAELDYFLKYCQKTWKLDKKKGK